MMTSFDAIVFSICSFVKNRSCVTNLHKKDGSEMHSGSYTQRRHHANVHHEWLILLFENNMQKGWSFPLIGSTDKRSFNIAAY